jgi:hypothetical protein
VAEHSPDTVIEREVLTRSHPSGKRTRHFAVGLLSEKPNHPVRYFDVPLVGKSLIWLGLLAPLLGTNSTLSR